MKLRELDSVWHRDGVEQEEVVVVKLVGKVGWLCISKDLRFHFSVMWGAKAEF